MRPKSRIKHTTEETHAIFKKLLSIVFEFSMVFLAVFMGFFAENYRETKSEEKRAEQLAQLLFKEVYADSINIQKNLVYRVRKEKECSIFINYVHDSSLTDLPPKFYNSFTWVFLQTTPLLFQPNDGILNELRNSGDLRYFKNNSLKAQIGELIVRIANLRIRNDREYGFVQFTQRPFAIKHYDFTWSDSLTSRGAISLSDALNTNRSIPYNGKIVNINQFDCSEAINITSYFLIMLRGTRQLQYSDYVKTNAKLLHTLRAEFNFK